MTDVQLITLTEANLGKVPLLCGHSITYRRGYDAKMEWLHGRIGEGMRYTLVQVHDHNAGMMETIPAEYAWRGVEAEGFLFIQCFWVVGRNRGHGYGQRLLEACFDDARGMQGVVVMVSKAHWLPTPKIFLKNGFELADRAAPSFDLLVKRFNPMAPTPRFKPNAAFIPPGLTLYHSDQCPYTQNVPEIFEKVGEKLRIPTTIIHLDNAQAAQKSPCLYGTLAYYFNGKFLTYHPTGSEKLLKLIKSEQDGISG